MRNQLLGQRYRILDRIGEGGMAYVYLALDEKLGRKVAVKVLHQHMEKNSEIRKRFQMEAESVSRLDHPNIVKIYDFSGSDSERLWIVTEVIRGKNLAQYAHGGKNGALHQVIATCIVREILKALARAHDLGIIHRDIKPENIMLTQEGRVKLMDFGIAKDLGKSNMTHTGTFMGSPSYMSPEQIKGRDIDGRTDLYSLSVLYYEIVTGRLPFVGQTTHDVIMRIMEGVYTEPRFLLPTLDEALNECIVKGMAKTSEDRIHSARDYGTILDRFLLRLGFAESHIELERYFENPTMFEERLSKTEIVTPNGASIGSLLKSAKTERGSPSPAAGTQSPLRRPASTMGTPERQNTKKLTHDRAVPALDRSVTMREPPALARPTALPQAPSVPKAVPLTEPQPQPMMRKPAPALSPAKPYQRRIPRPRVGKVRSRLRPLPPVRVAPLRIMPPRLPQVRVATIRPSILSKIIGVLLVGGFLWISLWGFVQLAQRLSVNKDKAAEHKGGVRSTPVTPKNVPRKEPPPRSRSPHKAPSVSTVRGPSVPDSRLAARRTPPPPRDERDPNQRDPNQRDPNQGDPNKGAFGKGSTVRPGSVGSSSILARNVPVTTVTRGWIKPQPSPQVSATERKTPPKSAPAPAPTVARETDERSVLPEKRVEQGTAVPTRSGQGRIRISSQPAAEILVDGAHVGTTVDATTHSGWLAVRAGRHQIELRRKGYSPYQKNIEIASEETLDLPKVVLEEGGAGESSGDPKSKISLTLRVNAVPAQVIIRKSGLATPRVFTLQNATRTLELEAGRYQIRIERGGQTIERDLVLKGGEDQLTFSADFKGEESSP